MAHTGLIKNSAREKNVIKEIAERLKINEEAISFDYMGERSSYIIKLNIEGKTAGKITVGASLEQVKEDDQYWGRIGRTYWEATKAKHIIITVFN